MKNYETYPSYFLCNRHDIMALVKKAEAEATKILKEFEVFYKTSGKLSIEITPIQHLKGYSIGGKLIYDGKILVEEDDCDMLFLRINNIMFNRMLQIQKEGKFEI